MKIHIYMTDICIDDDEEVHMPRNITAACEKQWLASIQRKVIQNKFNFN